MKYGILILAAGASSRLGTPKQLLLYGKKTLLQNAIDASTGVPGSYTIVITGAAHEEVEKSMAGSTAEIVRNSDWQSGMSSSIKAGIQFITKTHPQTEAVIICVCDQPHVSTTLLTELIRQHERTGKAIVASAYRDTVGTPALFSSRFFGDLLNLQGDEGAKKLIGKYATDALSVPFEKGALDIDTPADYEKIK